MDISKIKLGDTSYDIKDSIARQRTTNVTYDELVTLKNNEQLIPLQLYRIIDYVTTTKENDTRSALKPFDIIVTAISSDRLDIAAKATTRQNDSTTWVYNNNGGAIALEFWELEYRIENTRHSAPSDGAVRIGGTWYCRLSTSDVENATYPYAWGTSSDLWFSNSITPAVDDTLYSSSDGTGDTLTVEEFVKGKGTVLRMKDELGNDVPYDFKNILYRRYAIGNKHIGIKGVLFHSSLTTDLSTYSWQFTFCENLNSGTWLQGDSTLSRAAYNNTIKFTPDTSVGNLPNITMCLVRGNVSNSEFINCKNLIINGCIRSRLTDCSNICLYGAKNSILNTVLEKCSTIYCTGIVRGSYIYKVDSSRFTQCTTNYITNSARLTVGNTQKSRIQYATDFTSGYGFGIDAFCCEYVQLPGYLNNCTVNHSKYTTLSTTQTVSASAMLNNIEIKGVVGTSENFISISHDTINDAFVTTYLPANSQTISV